MTDLVATKTFTANVFGRPVEAQKGDVVEIDGLPRQTLVELGFLAPAPRKRTTKKEA